MNAAYNTLFGDPQYIGNGLASVDVTGIDVDAVMAKYEYHRARLVDLEVFAHVRAYFPNLASNGTASRSSARSSFIHRMWNRFPGHKHYYLASNGTFESWVPYAGKNYWNEFLESGMAMPINE